MTNKAFIRINKVVTADQAALVAAGINPVEVNNDVSVAQKGNWLGWHMAVTVRDALLGNLGAGHLDPEPLSISYWEQYGYDSAENVIYGIVDIWPTLLKKGVPDNARFNADSIWPWIAENLDIDPELQDCINAIYAPKTNAPDGGWSEDKQHSEQVDAIATDVSKLTERLRQAEEEIAILKAKKPTFRHLTPLLELVAEVQERYWGDNWDRDDPDTNTKQNDIIDWVESDPRCSSKKRAEVVAIAARPIT